VSSVTPYKPTTDDVKRLREDTGAGMLDCRAALIDAAGDYELAKKRLAEAGASKAAKKSERAAKEGLISSYIHIGGKIGVLVEVNCETDFVARSERFVELVHDIALHLAAMPVQYVSREAVPPHITEELRADFAKSAEDKPAKVIDRIVEGKLNKWYEEHVLLDQPFIKNDEQTIGDLIASVVGVLGENIQVRRYAKFALGGE
jgi:elongation factor Ts